ncbi:MAG: DUF4922 domain-containing protein [Bacteroidales bacterium]|nr:DUF4922 domain-containing protein [Bacteroidales bacterium]
MIDIDDFMATQLEAWPMAKENFLKLDKVKTKSICAGDSAWVLAQCNPARIASTGAKVDAATLKARRCFLCADNRPAEQHHIDWNGYEILINPFPIFPRHFTIPAKNHAPQRISGRLEDMGRLADELPGMVVFYNGPKCGASAPDHMHFQAGDAAFLPIFRQECEVEWIEDGIGVPKSGLPGYPGVIIVTGDSPAEMARRGEEVLVLLPEDEESGEPMVNLLCTKHYGQWRLWIIPRKKHRPSFYGDGEGQMLLSPASVDLGGVYITPRLEDYQRIDAETIEKALAELCYTNEEIRQLLEQLPAKEKTVKVGLLSQDYVSVEFVGGYWLGSEIVEGTYNVAVEDLSKPLLFKPTDPSKCYAEVKDVTIGVNFHWQRKENQRFLGEICLMPEDGKITVINILPIEDYLASVISSEMSATSSLELLKAHAVISRSWLLAQIEARENQTHTSHCQGDVAEDKIIRWYGHTDHKLFDVCADDHCQRYQGITRQTTPYAQQAVDETRGEVLRYQGELCDARFSKCCGGVFEEYESCWENDHKPYLVARRDDVDENNYPDLRNEEEARRWILSSPEAFCNTHDAKVLKQVLVGYDQETQDFYRWKVQYTTEELSELVARRSGIDFGTILALEPVERGVSGRLIVLRIVGAKRTMEIGKELEIRRILSESHLYSSAFVVERTESGFCLRGAGWGHGVGLCQIGAAVMADKGYDYRQILSHYYPGSEITLINEK